MFIFFHMGKIKLNGTLLGYAVYKASAYVDIAHVRFACVQICVYLSLKHVLWILIHWLCNGRHFGCMIFALVSTSLEKQPAVIRLWFVEGINVPSL